MLLRFPRYGNAEFVACGASIGRFLGQKFYQLSFCFVNHPQRLRGELPSHGQSGNREESDFTGEEYVRRHGVGNVQKDPDPDDGQRISQEAGDSNILFYSGGKCIKKENHGKSLSRTWK